MPKVMLLCASAWTAAAIFWAASTKTGCASANLIKKLMYIIILNN